ncbi:MAG: two-component system response regulator CpxR [Oleispira sp.]|jgi:DNA-binding response OmpR family regulator
MKILLVDDDQELCELLARYLQREGIEVDQVYTGSEGLQQGLAQPYDAMVLDVMMPGMTGLEVLTELRKTSQLPVVMLTAKGDELDRIVGLEIGADDYLPKPCNPRELIARLRAVFRRTHAEIKVDTSDVIHIDELEIDHGQHQVLKNNQPLDLTVTEYNILNTLVSHLGKVVGKNQLAEEAMSRSLTLFDRSLDMHLSNLRKKLGSHEDGQLRIKTIRGVGYMYVAAQS